ncbi:MAG TPA: glycine cleavage system aminomethyltransferase GcvT [Cytophagaceae bacterium]|jgi:aminomethyltransferase|nr:glycine cleavage system aminomethyltransferase GcvT [Cytophagaceae bacterium]
MVYLIMGANTETVKYLPLNDVHVALGGKMVPFGGFMMPVRYSSDITEHNAVRNNAGIFDVSHMGEFWVRGENALAALQYLTTNDVAKLEIGQAQYSCLPNEHGGIVDDLLIYKVQEKEYLVVVNASNIDKDWNWMTGKDPVGAVWENRSEETFLFAVQGPKAADMLQSLTTFPLDSLGYYTFTQTEFAGIKNVIVSATGYTGAGGFEIYGPMDQAAYVWSAILKAGAPHGLIPCGLGARDTLRLEMGYSLYGNDLSDETSPIAAGLGWIVKFNKDFIAKEILARQKAEGVKQKLVAFVLEDKGVPRSGFPVLSDAGDVIGAVNSGSISPVLEKGIGLGYVDVAFAKIGTAIKIDVRGRQLKAVVTKLPFISQSVKS